MSRVSLYNRSILSISPHPSVVNFYVLEKYMSCPSHVSMFVKTWTLMKNQFKKISLYLANSTRDTSTKRAKAKAETVAATEWKWPLNRSSQYGCLPISELVMHGWALWLLIVAVVVMFTCEHVSPAQRVCQWQYKSNYLLMKPLVSN